MIVYFEPETIEQHKLFQRLRDTLDLPSQDDLPNVFGFNHTGRYNFLNLGDIQETQFFDLRPIDFEMFQIIVRDYTILGDMRKAIIQLYERDAISYKSKGVNYEDFKI